MVRVVNCFVIIHKLKIAFCHYLIVAVSTCVDLSFIFCCLSVVVYHHQVFALSVAVVIVIAIIVHYAFTIDHCFGNG
jgi:hypothetical protein